MKHELTFEQSYYLDELIEQENEIAEAIKNLLSWGAGDRCAADESTDIEHSLRVLNVEDQSELLCYAWFEEIEEDELKGWIDHWYKLPVDWNDRYDVYEAWRSVCQKVNEQELAKIAVNKFAELLEFKFLLRQTGITKKKIAEFAGVTPITVTRWVNGESPVPPLVLEKLRQIDKMING